MAVTVLYQQVKFNFIFFQLNKEEALEVLPHKKKQASLEEEYEVDRYNASINFGIMWAEG